MAHGSRDPRSQVALERLEYLVAQTLEQLEPAIQRRNSSPFLAETSHGQTMTLAPSARRIPRLFTASLECHPLPLHQQIQKIAREIKGYGGDRLRILPLFLLPGVHVRDDLPQEIDLAQGSLRSSITLELLPHLGSLAGISDLLKNQCQQFPSAKPVLVAHGSRRPGGNSPMVAMAQHLGAEVAYWSMPPSLESVIASLATSSAHQPQELVVIPYFLFSGGISEAIAAQLRVLQSQYPSLRLHLGYPLGATPDLAHLISHQLLSP